MRGTCGGKSRWRTFPHVWLQKPKSLTVASWDKDHLSLPILNMCSMYLDVAKSLVVHFFWIGSVFLRTYGIKQLFGMSKAITPTRFCFMWLPEIFGIPIYSPSTTIQIWCKSFSQNVLRLAPVFENQMLQKSPIFPPVWVSCNSKVPFRCLWRPFHQ